MPPIRTLDVLAVASALALAVVGCAPATTSPPSVLLVTFDTTRADRIGAYGYAAAHTPTLDALARRGVLFEQAIAPAPLTLPSHASILTGVYPAAHGAVGNGLYRLEDDAVSIAEALRDQGWRTGASVGSYVLDARFGVSQGFEAYRAPRFGGSTDVASRTAGEVVDDALAWLTIVAPEERFFLWVHFFDPHAYYRAPPPWPERIADPYDAEIGYADSQLGRLLDAIAARGLAGNLLTVVTADHGESLGDHGEKTHGWFVYQATQHVPLIFSGPPVARAAGERVSGTVANLDVAASLLTLTGLPSRVMPDLQGVSLFDAEGRPTGTGESDGVLTESRLPHYTMNWRAASGLVWHGESYIEGDEPQLYDLAADPGELHDVAVEHPERVRAMQEHLEQLRRRHGSLGWATRLELGSADSERLQALGYLAPEPSEPAGDPFDPSLPEPRKRLPQVLAIQQANDLIETSDRRQREADEAQTSFLRDEAGRAARRLLEEARALVAPVVSANPDGRIAAQRLGEIEIRLGHHTEAIAALERAVALGPQDMTAHYNLGIAYRAVGRYDDATREFERAVALEPNQPRFQDALARHLAERAERSAGARAGDRGPGTPHP